MDVSLMAVAEQLAAEFADAPASTVVHAVTDCADEFPDSDLLFVAQAARVRLEQLIRAERNASDPPRDALEVTLEDTELLEEVTLLTDLIVAAAETDQPLTQDEIDALLGVA